MGRYSDFSRSQFSTMLEYYRTKKGLTRAELAHKTDISAPAITNYERGEREPTLSRFNDLADALGLADPILFFVNEDVKNLLSNNYTLMSSEKKLITSDRDAVLAELMDNILNLSYRELKSLNDVVKSMTGNRPDL